MSRFDLEALAFYTNDAITITDENAVILHVNQAFSRITGYSEAEVVGHNPNVLQSGRQDLEFYKTMWNSLLTQGSWQGRIWNRRKNGEVYSEWLQITRVINPTSGQKFYVAHFVDLREVNLELEKWRDLAYHDNLTGAYNRTYLREHYHHWSARLKHTPLVLMLIDLDRFKAINDQYGHDAGDLILQTVTQRLSQMIRPRDELIRLGGDEFLLIMEGDTKPGALSSFCEQMNLTIAAPIRRDASELSVGSSIGVAISDDPADTFEALYHQADLAMYHIKQQGGGYAIFPFDRK